MKWVLFVCSDCDEDEGVLVAQRPDDVNPDQGLPGVDNCPGCGSYLSMLNMGTVEVSGNALVHLRMRTPAEPD
jgi:hypothetical protein